MSRITTHILDTVTGKPGAEIRVHLDRHQGSDWVPVASAATGIDGRAHLAEDVPAATYRLTFRIDTYLAATNRTSIFPEISITFTCTGEPHYHLPVLLSNNSYTTYRGS